MIQHKAGSCVPNAVVQSLVRMGGDVTLSPESTKDQRNAGMQKRLEASNLLSWWVNHFSFPLVYFSLYLDYRQEICKSEGRYQMCPLCKVCPYWNMSSICSMVQV